MNSEERKVIEQAMEIILDEYTPDDDRYLVGIELRSLLDKPPVQPDEIAQLRKERNDAIADAKERTLQTADVTLKMRRLEAQLATTEAMLATYRAALEEIHSWNSLSAEYRMDYGSNGERDYYRTLAGRALALPSPKAALNSYVADELERMAEFTSDDRHFNSEQLRNRAKELRGEK